MLIELKLVTEAEIRAALRSGRVEGAVGDVLVELGRLEPRELQLAIAQHRERPHTPLEEIFVETHFASAADVLAARADLLNLTPVVADTAVFDLPLLKRAPMAVCRAHAFLPIRREDDCVLVVFAEPDNPQHLELARRHWGAHLVVGVGARRSVMSAIARAERELAVSVTATPAGPDGGAVALVKAVLDQALAERVSDIHFEPGREHLRIRSVTRCSPAGRPTKSAVCASRPAAWSPCSRTASRRPPPA